MKKRTFKKTVLGIALSLIMLSCNLLPDGRAVEQTGDPALESFETYLAEHIVLGDNGYLVEGCILFDNLEDVEKHYNGECSHSKSSVDINQGRWNRWTNTDKRNLSYKVEGFGANQAYMVDAMRQAAEAWEDGIDIDFIDKTGTNETALMTIRPATAAEEQQYSGTTGMAFFPYTYRDKTVIFFQKLFTNTDKKKLHVIQHELGHTLGLRHEHIWTNGQQTGETSSPAELITAHDTASVMYYDSKPGYSGQLLISPLDKEGVRILYGSKITGPTPTATATVPATPTPTATPIGTVSPWAPSKIYLNGDRVSHNGSVWESQWWNQGSEPGTSQWGPWKLVDGPVATPTATPVVTNTPVPTATATSIVTSTPTVVVTATATATTVPATPTPTTGTGTPAWAAGVSYTVGDLVSYSGSIYRCNMAHTAITGWEPPNVPALWNVQ